MTSPTPQANRFKFRAWQDILKEMRYFDLFELQAIDSLLDYKAINNGTLPIMQSTGLLDKNGKEIFEKDLLWNGMYYQDTGEKIVHTVEWREGRYFSFTQMGKSQASYPMMGCSVSEWKECEIIGNIYETPHLLPNPI